MKSVTEIVNAMQKLMQGEIDFQLVVENLMATHPEIALDVICDTLKYGDHHWIVKVREAAKKGKVPAIKELRKHTSMYLLDAKKWVEADPQCIQNYIMKNI